ncbi:hypothetical protein L0F63_004784, partial [Massospora cicadina]
MSDFKGSSPPPIPGIELNKRKPAVLGATPLNAFDAISDLPLSIETWSYAQVTAFIVQLLSLPRALEHDVKDFIFSRKIDGAKLAKLDEEQLGRLGFNKLWCHHLSAAVEDLTGKECDDETLLDIPPPSPDFEMRRKGHRAQASMASIKQFGSFSRPVGQDLETGHPNRPFSLPKVELALVRHYMLSETAGLKEELGRIKRELHKNAAKLISNFETTSEPLTPGSVDNKGNRDYPSEGTWFGFRPRTLTVAILTTLGIIGLISLRSRHR